ncbi:2Fe-2S iron-sulfur cluster-binding protein [Mariniradius saccharolyticus]|nr:2Fe-2S iron-sulfur cluster-binding protein [Mariniradius saccharolyticus]
MLKIVIQNLQRRELSSSHAGGKVIDLIHQNGIDWMHACGKKGRCITCKIIVLSGMENLSPLTEPEEIYRDLGKLKPNERLSCQAKIMDGELTVRVAEENKLPHIHYSE